MYDVVVIGGGIVGLSAAYHLQAAGSKTLLIDRADAGRATAAGAGILAPEASGLSSDAWFDFATEAVAYYPVLMERLAADDAGETGYARIGELVVAVSADEDSAFLESRRVSMERQQRRGQPTPEDLHDVEPEEARRLFPALGTVRRGYYYRQGARVDGRLIAGALRRAAERHGLTMREGSVEHLAWEQDVCAGVVLDGERINAGAVVIAGGAWSGAFADELGITIPIVPQRGQIIHLLLPTAQTATWPIITAFHGHYLVPWPDGRVVVGATREVGSGFVPQTTLAGVREVLDEALRVAPGLAAAAIADIRVGLRPATPDNLPLVGPLPKAKNLYLVAGHGATGLQLGPYSGKIIADMVQGRGVDVDLSALAVTRFSVNG